MTPAETTSVAIAHICCHECLLEDVMAVDDAERLADDHRALTGHDVDVMEVSRQ